MSGHRPRMNIVLRIVRLASRRRAGLAFWGAALAALLLSHDAVYLVQIGPGEELARTLRHAAHDYWGIASGALAAAAAVAALGAVTRLRRLRRRAASLGANGATRAAGTGSHLRRFVATWAAMAAVVAVGFVLQENVEHVRAHGHVMGIQALAGPEYPLAIPVIGLVTLLAAALAALVSGTEEALIAAIDGALRPVIRAARRLARPPLSLPPLRSALASAHAGRGPPWRLVTA